MNAPTNPSWRARLIFTGIAGALAIGAVAALPSPAQARMWISGPCCGWYGPGAYYGYGYYPPYYYAPPAAYYPPAYPAPTGPGPSGYTPQSGYPAPSAYAPQSPYPPPGPAPSAYTPQSAYPAPNTATPSAAAVTYTSKPAFTNASGQTCREYKADTGGGQPVFGTACRMADGQWRVVN
jgi:hypothetical protein